VELDWQEFCGLMGFVNQVTDEYMALQRLATPHDYTQQGRVTGFKVRQVLSGMLNTIAPHYIAVMIDSIIPDCPPGSPETPEETREIPLSSYLRFRSELYLITKTFDRLPKEMDTPTNCVLSKDFLISLFCACQHLPPPPLLPCALCLSRPFLATPPPRAPAQSTSAPSPLYTPRLL
jgi:hypothetical protein